MLLIGACRSSPLGKEFMPQLQEGSIMFITGIPSTSLDESIRVSTWSTRSCAQFPQVRSVLATIGRAEKGETADVNYMEVLLDLKPQSEWAEKISLRQAWADMQEVLEGGADRAVFGATQPIQMRVEELISGVRVATLALKLYGEDLETLDRLTGQIKGVLDKVPGVADLSAEANRASRSLIIKVDRGRPRATASTPTRSEVVQAGIGGSTVSTVIDGTSASTSRCGWPTSSATDPNAIASIPHPTGEGGAPLSGAKDPEMDEGYLVRAPQFAARYAVLQMDGEGPRCGRLRQGSRCARSPSQVKRAARLLGGMGGAFENQQRAMAGWR